MRRCQKTHKWYLLTCDAIVPLLAHPTNYGIGAYSIPGLVIPVPTIACTIPAQSSDFIAEVERQGSHFALKMLLLEL